MPTVLLHLILQRNSVQNKVGSDIYVITFARNKPFGMVYIRYRGLDGSVTVGRKQESWSAVVRTVRGYMLPWSYNNEEVSNSVSFCSVILRLRTAA
jgi:hypothetical protein